MEESKRTIKNREEAQMFALFLACERNRHKDDIENAERDLIKLKEKWDVNIPWEARYFTIV